MFELCISTVHTLTCTGDAGPEQSLVLLALKFEADKGYFNYRHQRSCQTYFCVVGTPKKRLSKAIVSSRFEGTVPDTTFGSVVHFP